MCGATQLCIATRCGGGGILRPGLATPVLDEVSIDGMPPISHATRCGTPPRLVLADKVHNLDRVLEVGQGWGICVRGVGGHVVSKRQAVGRVRRGPRREESVQKALVTTVERPLLRERGDELGVRVIGWDVHKNTRVEAVRPADVRSSSQLGPLKQIVDVVEDKRVGVEKDALGVLCERPACHLGRSDTKVWSTEQLQVLLILGIF
mmetsp:Transcript_8944/g.23060  ORF Transcript_8944/g.23060 Transcript_8944/m.23060 type:complete len:206 (-) Transcript_8944:232-849(-)